MHNNLSRRCNCCLHVIDRELELELPPPASAGVGREAGVLSVQGHSAPVAPALLRCLPVMLPTNQVTKHVPKCPPSAEAPSLPPPQQDQGLGGVGGPRGVKGWVKEEEQALGTSLGNQVCYPSRCKTGRAFGQSGG